MRLKVLVFVLVLAAFVLLTRSPSAFGCFGGGGAQGQGKTAPDFSVTRYADGRKVSLGDLRGNVVLLYFWFPT